jgi:hypothetical protein
MEALPDLRAVIIGIDTVFLGSGFQNGFNDWTGDLLLITQKLDQQYHPRPEEFSVPVSGMRGVVREVSRRCRYQLLKIMITCEGLSQAGGMRVNASDYILHSPGGGESTAGV